MTAGAKAVYEAIYLKVVTDDLDAEAVADRVISLYKEHT